MIKYAWARLASLCIHTAYIDCVSTLVHSYMIHISVYLIHAFCHEYLKVRGVVMSAGGCTHLGWLVPGGPA